MAEQYEIVKLRLNYAVAVSTVGRRGWAGEDALNTYIGTHSGEPPMPNFDKIWRLKNYELNARNFGEGAEIEDALRQAISDQAEQDALYTSLVDHLRKCSDNLSKNMKQGERRLVAATKKEEKKVEVDKRKELKQKYKDWGSKSKTIFDDDSLQESFVQVQKVELSKFDKNEVQWDQPFLITDAPHIASLLSTSEVYKTHFSLFQLGWPKYSLYETMGQGDP